MCDRRLRHGSARVPAVSRQGSPGKPNLGRVGFGKAALGDRRLLALEECGNQRPEGSKNEDNRSAVKQRIVKRVDQISEGPRAQERTGCEIACGVEGLVDPWRGVPLSAVFQGRTGEVPARLFDRHVVREKAHDTPQLLFVAIHGEKNDGGAGGDAKKCSPTNEENQGPDSPPEQYDQARRGGSPIAERYNHPQDAERNEEEDEAEQPPLPATHRADERNFAIGKQLIEKNPAADSRSGKCGR